jgi:hypothetical protein
VDPSSDKPFEFGTIEFPFKMFHYVFVELWNNFWDTTPNVTVYLKQGQVIPLYSIWYPINIINTNAVYLL